jgi:peptide/nickel transport system permease protein
MSIRAEPVPARPLRAPRLLRRVAGAGTAVGRSSIALIGLGLIAFWAIVALLAPWIAPYSPTANDFSAVTNPRPSATHWLGTDLLGRDILSRIMWGARTVLTIAPVATGGALVLGCIFGLAAGYLGGWVDAAVSRVCDILLSFPVIILYLIVIVNFGPSAINIIAVITITKAPIIARIVRGVALELRGRDYVQAARLRGESAWYVMFIEILPNARGPLIVEACLRMGYTTVAIGALGFLGVGLPPPTPDWGGMVREAYGLLTVYPHMALFPAIAITTLVVGFNLLAMGLREASLKP